MKILKKDVIANNLPLIRSFVRDIRPSDDATILDNRVGGAVTVSPDGHEAERIEVTFKTNIVVVVSKNSDAREVMGLLKVALAEFGGLGTGIGGVSGVQPVTNLGEATINTIEQIAGAARSGDVIPIHVPVHVGQATHPPKIKMTGFVSGWTMTNDTGSHELANVSFFVRLDGLSGNPVETKNEGTESRKTISQKPSEVTNTTAPPLANAYMQVDYEVETDGWLFYPTISLIQIKEIVMHFEYTA